MRRTVASTPLPTVTTRGVEELPVLAPRRIDRLERFPSIVIAGRGHQHGVRAVRDRVGTHQGRSAVGAVRGGGDSAAEGIVPLSGVRHASFRFGRRIAQRPGLRSRGVVIPLPLDQLDHVRRGVMMCLGLLQNRVVVDACGLGVGGFVQVVAGVLRGLPPHAVVNRLGEEFRPGGLALDLVARRVEPEVVDQRIADVARADIDRPPDRAIKAPAVVELLFPPGD